MPAMEMPPGTGSAVGDAQERSRLVGRGQWEADVAAAVRTDEEVRLCAWCADGDPAPPLHLFDTGWELRRARGVAACGLVALRWRRAWTGAEALNTAVQALDTAVGLLGGAPQGPARPLDAVWTRPLEDQLDHLFLAYAGARGGGDPVAQARDVVRRILACATGAPAAVVSWRVAFPLVGRDDAHAIMARLVVERHRPGLGTFHPSDPFARPDPEFRKALAAAWAFASRRYRALASGDVGWRVETVGSDGMAWRVTGRVEGPSVGLAAAVALAMVPRIDAGLGPPEVACAFTGSVAPDGTIGSVGAYLPKVLTAVGSGLRLVLPAADRRTLDPAVAMILPAGTVDEALAVATMTGQAAERAQRISAMLGLPLVEVIQRMGSLL